MNKRERAGMVEHIEEMLAKMKSRPYNRAGNLPEVRYRNGYCDALRELVSWLDTESAVDLAGVEGTDD